MVLLVAVLHLRLLIFNIPAVGIVLEAIPADHTMHTKVGRVCIFYYKKMCAMIPEKLVININFDKHCQ